MYIAYADTPQEIGKYKFSGHLYHKYLFQQEYKDLHAPDVTSGDMYFVALVAEVQSFSGPLLVLFTSECILIFSGWIVQVNFNFLCGKKNIAIGIRRLLQGEQKVNTS